MITQILFTVIKKKKIGNAKPPEILSHMILEAKEIRENQTYRSALSCVVTSAEPKDDISIVIYLYGLYLDDSNYAFY